MVKKKKEKKDLKKIIKDFRLIPQLIFLIVFLAAHDPIFISVCDEMKIETTDERYNTYWYGVYAVEGAFWLYLFWKIYREVVYFKKTGRNLPKDHGRYQRSYYELVEYFENSCPQRLDPETLPIKNWWDSTGLILGKVGNRLISYEPIKDGIVLFVWGRPGVGKSTAVIAPTCITFCGSLIVLDVKGELAKIARKNGVKKRILTFSTIDYEHSSHFDPLADIRTMDDEHRAEALDNLAITLIPEEASENAAYFIKVARGFFTGIFLIKLHEDNTISFYDICREICLNGYAYWGAMIDESGYETAMKYTTRFRDENEKNVGSGYGKLPESLQIFVNPQLGSLLVNDDHCISPADLDDGETQIYLQIDSTEVAHFSPLIGMFFEMFLKGTLKRRAEQERSGDRRYKPLAFVLDEFKQIPEMPSLMQMAELGRGFNCSIMIACQSITQVDERYGEMKRKTLVDCGRGHVFLSLTDPDTRDWGSRLIGDQKVLHITNNVDLNGKPAGRSVSEATERAVSPEAFSLLPNDESIIIYLDGMYVQGQKTVYYEMPKKLVKPADVSSAEPEELAIPDSASDQDLEEPVLLLEDHELSEK